MKVIVALLSLAAVACALPGGATNQATGTGAGGVDQWGAGQGAVDQWGAQQSGVDQWGAADQAGTGTDGTGFNFGTGGSIGAGNSAAGVGGSSVDMGQNGNSDDSGNNDGNDDDGSSDDDNSDNSGENSSSFGGNGYNGLSNLGSMTASQKSGVAVGAIIGVGAVVGVAGGAYFLYRKRMNGATMLTNA